MTYYEFKLNMGMEADNETEAYKKLHEVISHRLMFAGENSVISSYQIERVINKTLEFENDPILQKLNKAFSEMKLEELGLK